MRLPSHSLNCTRIATGAGVAMAIARGNVEHPLAALERLPMWEGDRYFLPLVFDHDPRLFHGFMPYANGLPVGWSYSRL